MGRPVTNDGSEDSAVTVANWSLGAVVLLWGLGPPVTKLVSAPPLVGAALRFWISVPVLWLAVVALRRPMTRQVLLRTVVAGLLFAGNQALIFAAVQHTSVAVISVMLALQPGVVLLVAGPLLGERATAWHVLWTVVGIAGVALVVLGGDPEVTGSVLGVVLAVGTMLAFTSYYVLTRLVRSRTTVDSLQWMAGTTLVAALAITPVAVLASDGDGLRQVGGTDWLYLAFVAIVVGVLGHTVMSWSHRYIAASRSSLVLLTMHVVAVAAAWPINGEALTWPQLVGGAVVLASVGAVVARPAVVVAPVDKAVVAGRR